MSGTDDTDDRFETDHEAEGSTEGGTDETTTVTDPDETQPGRSEADATETQTTEADATEEYATETQTTETDATEADATETQTTETDATEEYATEADLAALREDVASFADDLEERTVERDDLESDLRRYVRSKVRRNHARGWGPYLILLYGTAMTIGAFYSPFLGGGWAILAMLVIWLSVLGLYALFVLVGATFTALSIPGRLRDRVSEWRS